jgi:hypothetical protein
MHQLTPPLESRAPNRLGLSKTIPRNINRIYRVLGESYTSIKS